MKFKIIFIFILNILLSEAFSSDIESYELNRIDLTPLHDAIIFNDIAQIMNEFESSMNTQLSSHIFSGSDSEEDIENLLSEYQHYLNKAHKQRLNYVEKNKGKNKVPLFRHDKFTKLKPTRNNYDETIHQATAFIKPLDRFISQNSNNMMIPNPKNIILNNNNAKTLLSLPSVLQKSTIPESIESSCYCPYNEIPCKHCLIPLNPSLPEKIKNNQNSHFLNNILNFRIKIDVQLPNISAIDDLYKHPDQDKTENQEPMKKNTLSTINLPFPYFNIPIPLELIGYKNNPFSYEPSVVHRINVQKKKRARLNNNSKKHKSKKLVFHSFEINPQIQINNTEKVNNDSEINKNIISNNSRDESKNSIGNITYAEDTNLNYNTSNPTSGSLNKNASLPNELAFIENGSKNENHTNKLSNTENSIEIDSENINNNAILTSLRLKRDINATVNLKIKNGPTYLILNNESNISHAKEIKRFNKIPITDTELLYWPVEYTNQSLVHSKNITALIFDAEKKKAKSNMTHYTISNTSMVLEQIIFGDVDWNDLDTVVPVFMSFVGKYISGMLTFCSREICHSIRCTDKICFNRICTPEFRHKNKGHCTRNKNTEIVTKKESLTDLPTNVTFDVVNILQDKMLGRLYGKITLCISSKCCTFAVSKKHFQKSICTFKELNSTGHCLTAKTVKS